MLTKQQTDGGNVSLHLLVLTEEQAGVKGTFTSAVCRGESVNYPKRKVQMLDS